MNSLLQRSRRQQAVPSGAELRPGCVLQLCAVPGSPPRPHGALCPARPWSSVCGGAGRAQQRMLGGSAYPQRLGALCRLGEPCAALGCPPPPRGALHRLRVSSTASGSPHASWCSAPPRGALRRQARASPRGPLAAFPLGRPASDGPRGLVSRAAAPAAPVVLLSKRRDVLARPPSLCRTGRSRTPWAPSAFPPAPGWVGSPDRVGLATSLPPRPRPTCLGAPLCSLEGKQTLIDPTKHAVGEAVIPAACGNPSAGGLIHSV